ncbi:MAG: hypothetical protein QXU18_08990 [Thermoplasmatales archaeon]
MLHNLSFMSALALTMMERERFFHASSLILKQRWNHSLMISRRETSMEFSLSYQTAMKGIRKSNYVMTPGRYVGTEEQDEDDEEFHEKTEKLTTELKEQMEESKRLDEEIKNNLRGIGYDI